MFSIGRTDGCWLTQVVTSYSSLPEAAKAALIAGLAGVDALATFTMAACWDEANIAAQREVRGY